MKHFAIYKINRRTGDLKYFTELRATSKAKAYADLKYENGYQKSAKYLVIPREIVVKHKMGFAK